MWRRFFRNNWKMVAAMVVAELVYSQFQRVSVKPAKKSKRNAKRKAATV